MAVVVELAVLAKVVNIELGFLVLVIVRIVVVVVLVVVVVGGVVVVVSRLID